MDYLDVNVDLLDRQVVDSEDVPLCKVDDLRFERGEDGRWRVSEILVGPGALGDRFRGQLGAVLTGIHRRMRGLSEPRPPGIEWRNVLRLDSDVRLSVPRDGLSSDLDPLEQWLRDHIVERIPGSRHASS